MMVMPPTRTEWEVGCTRSGQRVRLVRTYDAGLAQFEIISDAVGGFPSTDRPHNLTPSILRMIAQIIANDEDNAE